MWGKKGAVLLGIIIIDGEPSTQLQVILAAAGSKELRVNKPSIVANEICINAAFTQPTQVLAPCHLCAHLQT